MDKMYQAPPIKLNPQTGRTFDESGKPRYVFGGFSPELEERFHIPDYMFGEPQEPCKLPEVNLSALCNNHIYEITRNLLLMIGDEEDKAYVKAVRQWAEEKGYDEVLLIDEEKLKTILKLGAEEYERLNGGMK